MKNLKLYLLLFYSILLLSACASQRLSSSTVASNDKIVIFSDLGDDFQMAKIGIGANQMIISVVGWNLDSYIENNLAEKLHKIGKTPVLMNKPKNFQLMKDHQLEMMNLAKKANADLMIVVSPFQSYVGNQLILFPAGYGIVELHSIWGQERGLYASVKYQIYSVKTGALLAYYEEEPNGDKILKLPIVISFYKLTINDILKLLPEMHHLMNLINGIALNKMGL